MLEVLDTPGERERERGREKQRKEERERGSREGRAAVANMSDSEPPTSVRSECSLSDDDSESSTPVVDDKVVLV